MKKHIYTYTHCRPMKSGTNNYAIFHIPPRLHPEPASESASESASEPDFES